MTVSLMRVITKSCGPWAWALLKVAYGTIEYVDLQSCFFAWVKGLSAFCMEKGMKNVFSEPKSELNNGGTVDLYMNIDTVLQSLMSI